MQNSSVLLESAGKSDIIFLTDSKEESVGSNMAYLENITKNPAELIRQSYQTLSPVQKRIADLILGEIETVCFLRLDEVSKKADVTTVTVIRFVKKLGYESYGAFKKELQNYVQTMIIPKRIVKAEIQNFREAPASDIIRQAIENEFALMSATYDELSAETLTEAAQILKNARKIYIAGTGLNHAIAEMLLVRLNFLCLDAQILPFDNLTLLPYLLASAGPEDAFIIFSFPNYKEFAIDVAKCAKSLGSHTICITDKLTSPVAPYAEKLLLCQTSSLMYYNSMTVAVSLVTVLSTILAVQMDKDPQTQERLDQISSFFR